MTSKVDIKERIEYIVTLNSALLERSGYSQEAYSRVVLNAMVKTPQIADCDTGSLTKALLDAMNAGLVPDGREAAIVPLKGKAKLWVMVDGRQKLAMQASPNLSLRTKAVYAGDEWEYEEGLDEKLRHVPSPTASQAPEHLIYAYAIGRVSMLSERVFVVLSRAQIDRRKAWSASPNRGPWVDKFEEMALTAARKALFKLLPTSSLAPVESPEFDRLDALEDATTLGGETVDMTTGEIMEAEGLEPQPRPGPQPRRIAASRKPVAVPDEAPPDDDAPF